MWTSTIINKINKQLGSVTVEFSDGTDTYLQDFALDDNLKNNIAQFIFNLSKFDTIANDVSAGPIDVSQELQVLNDAAIVVDPASIISVSP